MQVIKELTEKEGRKDDKKVIDNFMSIYGKDIILLSFRILDELLSKEQKTSRMQDFSKILIKEIFLKSVFVCSTETVFFIGNVRQLQN